MKIVVNVVDRGERGFYLRWRQPNGKLKEEAAGTKRRRDAMVLALAKEKRLKSLASGDGSIGWEDWRDSLEDYCSGRSEGTESKLQAVLNQLVVTMEGEPASLAEVTTSVLSSHATRLRKLGRSENTIACHFRTLRAVLMWSVEQGVISEIPKIPSVPRSRKHRSRGRPLTDQEFATLLDAVPAATEPGAAESWKVFLRGLWYSGLRLSEALALTWGPSKSGIWLDYTGSRPRLVIRSYAEKGNEDRLLPITPDFAEFLEKHGRQDGNQRVFRPIVRYGRETNSRIQCSHVISAIGRAAKVETEPGQFVTAHDLRRSFGLRWSMLVTPAVLQQLMRHASINTTMEFYARADADRWADAIYAAWQKQVNPEVNGQKDDGSKK